MAVYKRGKRWHINYSLNGRRYSFSAGPNSSKREALELEARHKAQVLEEEKHAQFGTVKDHTFDEAIARWINSGAPKSMYGAMRLTLGYLMGTKLSKSLNEISAMRDEMLKKGLKPASINRQLSVARKVLRLAFEEWGWLKNPLHLKVKKLPEKNAREVFLTPHQVEDLADACECPRVAELIRLIAYTGLRRAEAIGLSDGCFDGKEIRIKGKGDKYRNVPVPEQFHSFLADLPHGIPDIRLRRYFDRAKKKIDMEHITIHDLRHTYASWLAKCGTPMGVIRDLLGHSSVSVTNRYMHFSRDDLSSAVENMTKTLNKEKE